MRLLRLTIPVAVLLMSVLTTTFTAQAAQSEASPVAVASANDLNLPGIDSQLLGNGTSAAPLAEMPRMILERISLSAGSALPAHTTGGPELLVAEIGAPLITDSFGFVGQIASGGTFLDAGAQYTLSNPGTDEASALRLSVLPGQEMAAASPVAADATVTVLIDSPLGDPRLDSPTLTIAQLTWHPGVDPQVLDHDGALGLLVLDGTLMAKSPSGLEGQLTPNTPVVFPANIPLIAHAGGDGPASALIVSITDGASPIVTALAPTPTPIPTATPKLEPSRTPRPTETPIPSITPTPSPTPDLMTVQGAILQMGQNWRSGDGSLVIDIKSQKNIGEGEVTEWSAYFTYTNMGTTRQDFVVPAGFIQVRDDNGDNYATYISGNRAAIGSARVILDGGSDFTFEFGFRGTGNDGNVLVSIDEFGPIVGAAWGFTFSQGEMLPIAETNQATFPTPTSAKTPVVPTISLELDAKDIAFSPWELTINAADEPVTIKMVNTGAAPHNFTIDSLGISVDVNPGEAVEVVIPAGTAPGTYDFYCDVPGHKEAGMVGTLIVK